MPLGPRPGLTKIRAVPLLRERRVRLVHALPGRVEELVARADVVSEGATRLEDGAPVYYGTTSLRLPSGAGDPERVAAVLAVDPTLRVLALRVARRELAARVASEVGTLRAEMAVAVKGGAVVVDVDIVAPIATRARVKGDQER
jgi:hypothetical protein